MSTRPTQEQFLSDVASHAMTIEHDDGVYRCLCFQRSEHSWLHRFEIVTWPNALCIRGDVGTYVFSRLPDMFEFFRGPVSGDSGLYINADYWAEKLISSDCHGRRGDGVMRYDPDIFSEEVKRRYVEHVRGRMRGMPDERRDLRRALEDEVLAYAEESETEARRAADSFEQDGFRLTDFWEVNCSAYTTQFIWSLYAIAWAIQQYDKHHATASAEAA